MSCDEVFNELLREVIRGVIASGASGGARVKLHELTGRGVDTRGK